MGHDTESIGLPACNVDSKGSITVQGPRASPSLTLKRHNMPDAIDALCLMVVCALLNFGRAAMLLILQ